MSISFKDLQGSAYAGRWFLSRWYVKYWGNPVYKWCRKKGLNPYFSYMGANTLGSGIHMLPFLFCPLTFIIGVMINMVFFTSLLYILRLLQKKLKLNNLNYD